MDAFNYIYDIGSQKFLSDDIPESCRVNDVILAVNIGGSNHVRLYAGARTVTLFNRGPRARPTP